MSTTKTATISAWLPSTTDMRPTDLYSAESKALADTLGYSSRDMATCGWVRVGNATITLDLLPMKDLTQQTIDALRREQAELQAKCTQIDRQINNLLAIEHSAPTRRDDADHDRALFEHLGSDPKAN